LDYAGTNTVCEPMTGYETLWDPKLANEAEQRGEDISGFLEGEHELSKKELLFSILHKKGYCVKSARIEYERLQSLDKGYSSTQLSRDEARQFEGLIQEGQKNFSSIAKTLKRKRSDCMVHYYRWKASNRCYHQLKKKWNLKQWKACSVCEEGGNLIVCDGCSSSFHMECAKPRLTKIPEGDWFCHTCHKAKSSVKTPLSSICAGKKEFSSGETTRNPKGTARAPTLLL